ncbi:RteC domain-containing protein, partial [Chryseosolibacter indicus]
MISFANEVYQKLEGSLNKLQPEDSLINTAEKSIDIILESIDSLKDKVKTQQFETVGEEILFFKQIKPKFTSKLIYYVELIKIEGKRPIGSTKSQEEYLTKQLGKLESYFDDNVDFYQYYRSGGSYLDEKYFVRKVFDIRVHQDAYSFDHDPDFSTSHDFKVAKILANEQLRNYLNRCL